jgi:hypothetical protein
MVITNLEQYVRQLSSAATCYFKNDCYFLTVTFINTFGIHIYILKRI